MTLSDLAAVGSFLSGIAVVISVIFLTLQMRQSNRNQRSLIQQARTGRNIETLLRITDEYISETIAEADLNCATLSPARIWAFYGLAGAVFWSYEDSFMQFRAKTLDRRSWDSDVATIRRLLGYPAYRVAWKMARGGMSGEYRDYVDAIMREVKIEPATLTDLWKTYTAEEISAM
ncbi:MAG TPA: hypothetical protein VG843_00005 [Rhizomicrobium sp.]|jgi:hypothetical protein|nr:hypothetical protein [Rhizomicrobium sp.]HVZ90006.1 hypothetical protein [Rhizomicrobium sp.]